MAKTLLALIAFALGAGHFPPDLRFVALLLGSFAVEHGPIAVDLFLGPVESCLGLSERVVAASQEISRARIPAGLETLISFVSQAFPLVRPPLAPISDLLPLIGDPLPLVRPPLALVGDTVSPVGLPRSLIGLLPCARAVRL